MSVADIDGLLYTSEHPVEKLDQALRIDALSVGWRRSFEALRDAATKPSAGNVGLSPLGASAAPAWPGFRTLTVTAKRRESDDVVSFSLASEDGSPLPSARPGQYLTVRAKPCADGPVETRSYSLCGAQGIYRLGVKRDGKVSALLHETVEEGGAIEAAAPRGAFVLGDEDAPVVLMSAGMGATPVLACCRRRAQPSPVDPSGGCIPRETAAIIRSRPKFATASTRCGTDAASCSTVVPRQATRSASATTSLAGWTSRASPRTGCRWKPCSICAARPPSRPP